MYRYSHEEQETITEHTARDIFLLFIVLYIPIPICHSLYVHVYNYLVFARMDISQIRPKNVNFLMIIVEEIFWHERP